jgi:hypothetical protein
MNIHKIGTSDRSQHFVALLANGVTIAREARRILTSV